MLTTAWTCRRCLTALARRPLSELQRKVSTNASLPPALLARARKIASEHERLTLSLAADFDPKIAKKAGELSSVAGALKQWETAQESLDELASLRDSNDAELRELALEDFENTQVQLEQSSHELSVALTPKHPFADMSCLIEVVPGPGGIEGRLFAETIFQMYLKYCSNKAYRWRVIKHETTTASSHGEVSLQEAVLEVQDPGAYGIFRGEAGMHRVQRVPLTDSSGRTHTSAVAVWVLPSFPDRAGGDESNADPDFDDPESDFYINPDDVRSEVMRARGAGGQHVNKTESAIRLTHVPTGTVVGMQDSRSQHRNREMAWRLLRSRIAQARREEREAEARSFRDSVLARTQVTRGDKIRTYNYGQDRCTDHRCGLDLHNLPDVLDGGESLGKLFDSVQAWSVNKDIQAVIDEEETTALPPAPGKGSKPKR